MRLYNIAAGDSQELAVEAGTPSSCCVLSHNGLEIGDMNSLIDLWSPELENRLKEISRHGTVVPLKSLKVCAPIPHPKQDVICLGINYYSHAREAAGFSEEAFGGERPATIYFSKRCAEAPGPGDPIPSYEGLVDSLDYECELAVIIGKTAVKVLPEEALDYVFGYTVFNDVSARNLQTAHQQWYFGKSLDGFAPMGPCIVTPEDIPDPQTLAISCRVNGELRQDSNTSLMMKTVAGAISELSQGMTLIPGTIIATGTPAGVGMGMKPPRFLKTGDVVECTIEKIGTLKNVVR